jgi:hypothetical protein
MSGKLIFLKNKNKKLRLSLTNFLMQYILHLKYLLTLFVTLNVIFTILQILTILQFEICDCLVMYIENYIFKTINNKKIMQGFQGMKTRKEQLNK